MQKLGGLGLYCFDDLRVTVADAGDGPAWEHVEYFVSVGVVHVAAFAFDDDLRQPAVVCNDVFIEHFNCFLRCHKWKTSLLLKSLLRAVLSGYLCADALVGVNLEQQ